MSEGRLCLQMFPVPLMTGGITTLEYLDANGEEDEQRDGICNGIRAAEQEKETALPSQAQALTKSKCNEIETQRNQNAPTEQTVAQSIFRNILWATLGLHRFELKQIRNATKSKHNEIQMRRQSQPSPKVYS